MPSLNYVWPHMFFFFYVMFLMSLALEWQVNALRSIILVLSVMKLQSNPSLRSALFASNTFRLSLLFPVIALGAWLLGPYGGDGLKTFDWIFCLVIGFVAAVSLGNTAVWSLLTIPIVSVVGAVMKSLWSLVAYGDLSGCTLFGKRMNFYNRSVNRMALTFSLSGALVLGFFPLIKKRYLLHIIFLFCCTVIFCWLTQSRSGAFSLIATVCIGFFVLLKRGHVKILPIIIFFGILIGASTFLEGDRILETVSAMSWDFLLNGRGDIWQASWEIFQKFPLVGIGVDSFHDALSDFLALPQNIGRFSDIPRESIFWNAHQIILGVLCETGILGLTVFALMISQATINAIRNYPITFPLFLLLVAYLIAGFGGYGFHRSWNSAFFFLGIGLIDGLRYNSFCMKDECKL